MGRSEAPSGNPMASSSVDMARPAGSIDRNELKEMCSTSFSFSEESGLAFVGHAKLV